MFIINLTCQMPKKRSPIGVKLGVAAADLCLVSSLFFSFSFVGVTCFVGSKKFFSLSKVASFGNIVGTC